MALELDHVYCFCDDGQPEIRILETHGLPLTSGRRHKGQGTQNRSLEFASQYLELIYLYSEEEARQNPLQLHKRAHWRKTGASPLGIGLRGRVSDSDRSQFWSYRPSYLPDGELLIHNWNESRPDLPMIFVIPSRRALVRPSSEVGLFHELKLSEVTIETGSMSWPLNEVVPRLRLKSAAFQKMVVTVQGGLDLRLNLNSTLDLIIQSQPATETSISTIT